MAMGAFESGIGDVAVERTAVGKPGPAPLVKRIENFAVDNMKSLAVGASAAVLLMGAAVLFTGPSSLSKPAGSVQNVDAGTTGSVAGQLRAPALPEWQVIRKPQEIIALQAPQFEKMTAGYSSRRSSRNDREDAVLFTSNAPGGPEARIALTRSAEPTSAPSLFVDMTRRQAERGVSVTRSGAPGLVMTKFGAVEVSDMTFGDAGGASQACLAFRRLPEGHEPMLSGWVCAPQGQAVERPELACVIDRLSLLKSGEDQNLRRWFAEAEPRRRVCPTGRNVAGRKPTWLDQDGRAPAIRGADDIHTGSVGKPKR
jgi:hypothetical protein